MKEEVQQNDSHEQLQHIRSMMEESTKFISLSGMSGVMAGITALCGAAYGHFIIKSNVNGSIHEEYTLGMSKIDSPIFWELLIGATVTLLLAVMFGAIFTFKKARTKGVNMWGSTSRKLLFNLLIPLSAGGIMCLALAYHGAFGMIAPATLVFYGLALINASKYTLRDIRNLGILELILGLISSFFIGYGILFWAIGFGILHIIYGVLMYYKYDRA